MFSTNFATGLTSSLWKYCTFTGQTHLCSRQMSKAKSAHSEIICWALVTIGHYGRHLTRSYTISLKCTFLIIHSSVDSLANKFTSFFINNVSISHSSFSSGSCSSVLNPPDTRKVLQNPTCVTDDEVCRLVLLASCKSSDWDPIPTNSNVSSSYLSATSSVKDYWYSSNNVMM